MSRICLLTGVILVLGLAGGARADLLGYWPLDGDGTDLSGNESHGTVNGAVAATADRFRDPTGAMWFPGGSGDNINLGNESIFNLTGEMTLTAWVRLEGTNTNNCRILAKAGGGGARSWSLNIENLSGGVQYPPTLQVSETGAANVSLVHTESLPADRWVHMTGVYRPGEAMEIYLNGVLAAVRTDSIPASQFSNNNLAVLIGNRHAASNCGWFGAIDEVRMFDEALSQPEIESLVWTFSAGRPDPTDRADRTPVDPVLSWRAPDSEWLNDPNGGVQYIVYFDPNELLVTAGDESVRFGPQDETSFAPGGNLDMMTTYYWRVDVVDPNYGGPLVYPGVVWNFTTLPPKAGLIGPADGATDAGQNTILEWDPGFGAIAHDVYFGTDSDLVAAGDATVYVGRKSETFLDPNIEWQTQYFWRVDEIFASGDPELGDVWSFTTTVPVCESPLDGDFDGDCDVDLTDLAIMAANWAICNLTNGDCP